MWGRDRERGSIKTTGNEVFKTICDDAEFPSPRMWGRVREGGSIKTGR
jgi:hypothetical protein